jgi:hypothetical protein
MSIAPSFQSTFLGQKPSKARPKKPKKTVEVKSNGNNKRRKKTT